MSYRILAVFLCVAIVASCAKEKTAPLNTSPIPRIIELSPENASAGDVLSIIGMNFSDEVTENEVKFNQSVVEIVSASDTLIQVIVPELSGNTVGVSVRSHGKISNKRNLSLVRVKVFEDNFDRADVPSVDATTTPNPIGLAWQIVNGSFELKSNRLFSEQGGSEAYLFYRDPELSMEVGDGSYYKLTADIKTTPESFAGIIFNAQSDNKRFYLLRTTNNMLQLLKTGVNGLGDWANIMINESLEGFAPNTPYRVEVASSQPGKMTIKIINIDTNGILFERAVEDANPYFGGVPGFYYFGLANPVAISFDNFRIETL